MKNNYTVKHFIFDFDGTISDSYPIFIKIFHEISEEKGLLLNIDDETLNQALQVSVKNGFVSLGWDKLCDLQELSSAFKKYQAQHTSDFCAFPEAVELLKRISNHGKKAYVYTHSGAVVNDILKCMGLFEKVEFVLDASYGFPRKPAPDALHYFLNHFGLEAKSCMMIGDRPIDAQAGMNAGMLGCLWDPNHQYEDFMPDIKVVSLLDIEIA